MSYKKLLAISSLALLGFPGFPPASHAGIVGGGSYTNYPTSTTPGGGCGRVYIYNPTSNWVWVTIYTLDRVHILDSGAMGANVASTVEDSSILCGSFYEVRTQVMSGYNVICDTGAQINPTVVSSSFLANIDSQTVTVENCYLGEGNASIPPGMQND